VSNLQKPNRLKEMAEKEGVSTEDLVRGAIKKHGSVIAASQALNVSPTSVRYWLKKMKVHIEMRRVAVLVEVEG